MFSRFWHRLLRHTSAASPRRRARKGITGRQPIYWRPEVEPLEKRINLNTTLNLSSGGLQILIDGADIVNLGAMTGNLVVTDTTPGQVITDTTGKFIVTGSPGNQSAIENSSLASDFSAITITGTGGGQMVNFVGGSYITTNVNDGTISAVGFNGSPSFFGGSLSIQTVSSLLQNASITASGPISLGVSGSNASQGQRA